MYFSFTRTGQKTSVKTMIHRLGVGEWSKKMTTIGDEAKDKDAGVNETIWAEAF